MSLEKRYALLGKITALITFLVASVIMVLYYQSGDLNYGLIGFAAMLFFVLINGIVFLLLSVKASKYSNPKPIRRSIWWMVGNIPIALFYFVFAHYLTGVMRIEIENTTGERIAKIEVSGCDTHAISELNNGDSKEVWISIHGDCAIEISYTDAKGEKQEETIIGYVTTGMGQRHTYKIGRDEKGW